MTRIKIFTIKSILLKFNIKKNMEVKRKLKKYGTKIHQFAKFKMYKSDYSRQESWRIIYRLQAKRMWIFIEAPEHLQQQN